MFGYTLLKGRDELQRVNQTRACGVLKIVLPRSKLLGQSSAEVVFRWVCDMCDLVGKCEDVLFDGAQQLDVRVIVSPVIAAGVVNVNDVELSMRIPG